MTRQTVSHQRGGNYLNRIYHLALYQLSITVSPPRWSKRYDQLDEDGQNSIRAIAKTVVEAMG